MNKIHIVAILALVVLFAGFVISDGLSIFDNETQDQTTNPTPNLTNEKVISVDSDDFTLTGVLHITEYKNKESINKSEGVGTDIQIVNGQASYKLKNDTKFFKVDSVPDIVISDSSGYHRLNVDYYVGDDLILTGSSDATNPVISFGQEIYSIDGKLVEE